MWLKNAIETVIQVDCYINRLEKLYVALLSNFTKKYVEELEINKLLTDLIGYVFSVCELHGKNCRLSDFVILISLRNFVVWNKNINMVEQFIVNKFQIDVHFLGNSLSF